MIEELLGSGSNSAPTKISDPFSLPFPSTTPLLNAATSASTATIETKPRNSSSNGGNNNNNNNSDNNQRKLKCPRCDSTNTKFCYYNNYNLTQPRHFCKSCRRYWTKGGTLRNIPIGGGCRKNKTSTAPISGAANKAKTAATLSTQMLVAAGAGSDPAEYWLQPSPNPIPIPISGPSLWPSTAQGQTSQILALLRGRAAHTNYPGLNPSPSSSTTTPISSSFVGLALKTESEGNSNTTVELDPYGNGAPYLLGSFSRSNPNQVNGFGYGFEGPGVVPNGGNGSNILELFDRLRSTTYYNYGDNQNLRFRGAILGNEVGSSSSLSSSSGMNSTLLDEGGNLGGYGIMSSTIPSWSDFPVVPY